MRTTGKFLLGFVKCGLFYMGNKNVGNLHLDLNPWSYATNATDIESLSFDNLRDFSREINMVSEASGPHLQGVLALVDNHCEDGGTLLVPRFHTNFDGWRSALGRIGDHLTVSKGNNWLVPRPGGGGSYKFATNDPIYSLSRRIPLRAGSMVIWDQRVVHGSQPNNSDRPRIAQFIKACRRDGVSKMWYERRRHRVLVELEKAGTRGLVNESWGPCIWHR